MTGKRGMSLVEAIVGVTVLAIGFIPVLTMTTSTTRESTFTEFHTFMQARALRILEKFSTYRYGELKKRVQGDGSLKIDFMEKPLEAEEYKRMQASYTERCDLEEVEPGLCRLTVTIEWHFPMDRPGPSGKKGHKMVMSRLVADPIMTWKERGGLLL